MAAIDMKKVNSADALQGIPIHFVNAYADRMRLARIAKERGLEESYNRLINKAALFLTEGRQARTRLQESETYLIQFLRIDDDQLYGAFLASIPLCLFNGKGFTPVMGGRAILAGFHAKAITDGIDAVVKDFKDGSYAF